MLGEWLPGDNAAIDELLAVFRDSIRAELTRMGDLLAEGQLVEFASAAHRLHGAALSMGARPLAEFVRLLFNAARANDRTACMEGIPLLAKHVLVMEAEVPTSTGGQSS